MRADDLGAVVRLYNDAVAAIPCNWPLTVAEFSDALLGNGTLSSPGRKLDPDTVYVAGTQRARLWASWTSQCDGAAG